VDEWCGDDSCDREPEDRGRLDEGECDLRVTSLFEDQ